VPVGARGTARAHGAPCRGSEAAIGSDGPFTLIVDRTVDAGGGGLGFQRRRVALSRRCGLRVQRLFRGAARQDLSLRRDVDRVRGRARLSTGNVKEVDIEGEAPDDKLDALVRFVDEIAELPNWLRQGTTVSLRRCGRTRE
jgi:hypothetical protein